LQRRGITEPDILAAFLAVPREQFVSAENAHLAYGDHPLPIEAKQTISQPYIVALTIQAAGIKPGDKVLEVGSGSGYAAAVISRIAGKVIGIERQHELVVVARERLERLGYIMSRSSKAMAPEAAEMRRRSMRSSPRQAEAMFRKPSSPSFRRVGGL
jgi:protein-L-isoaspartate(D-aspartate) O-methyltransferase